jgi:MoaA/NifB/PqqE/SkfB family radical SAM enzyme
MAIAMSQFNGRSRRKILLRRAKLFLDFNYAKAMKQHKPLVALLFLTSRCNASCSYCFAPHRGESKDLPAEAWKGLIDELKRRGTRLIFLMGGEPLLHKAFAELVAYVKSLGLECHVTTNGVLIPQHLETLKLVDLLMVSLDGNRAGNDLNRGQGMFDLTVRGIKLAKENKIPLRINAVLTRNNVDDIQWLLDFGDSVNAYVGFTIPAECTSLNTMKEKVLTRQEIIAVHKQLLHLAKQGRKITLSEESIEHVINYPREFNELVYKTEPDHKQVASSECPYGRFIVFINAEGFIYPCTTIWEMPKVFVPKNLFHEGLDESLRNAQQIPCWSCYCAGSREWAVFSSYHGLIHAIKFSLSQI